MKTTCGLFQRKFNANSYSEQPSVIKCCASIGILIISSPKFASGSVEDTASWCAGLKAYKTMILKLGILIRVLEITLKILDIYLGLDQNIGTVAPHYHSG